ncbi:hypothetical protein GGR55DRAFT_620678 [Xylaria sp. FL0064]|nr:hypothetical protein GGR55DRAFT_620678 [Xylaria sp. FL0064]
MRLEQREIAAFVASFSLTFTNLCGWNWHRRAAKRFGWIEERDGNLDDLTTRGHEWVNGEIFKKWTGERAVRILMHAMNGLSTVNPLKDSKETGGGIETCSWKRPTRLVEKL